VSSQLDLVAIGRVSVDLYGQQTGSRLEDVTTFAKGIGGCPANVAIGAARLGLKTALVSRVGDEPMGRFVLEQLAREGVDTSGVRVDSQRLTSLVLLSVRDQDSFPLIFYRENCADGALCEDDIDEALITSARAVLVTGTHFSIPAAARAQRKAIELARAHRARVVLDIDYRPNLWGIGGHGAGESRYARSATVTAALTAALPECDLIVGTEEELHVAAGVEDTLEAIRRVRALSNAVIVCKRGARGCAVFPGAIPAVFEDALLVAGVPVEIYNVLGAGDAFLAGFLLGFLRDAPHEESARQANACGALAVSRLLCSSEFATAAELEHFLAKGSVHAALRQDAQLNHLHWVTTRAPGSTEVQALAIDGAALALTAGRAGATPQRLAELRGLVVEAVAQAVPGGEGGGVLIDAAHGAAALRDALHRKLWVAGTVHRPGSWPLEFELTGSLASQLIEWPAGITVACRIRCQPDDRTALRTVQEQNLLRLAAACRAQRRELLLGVAGARPGGGGSATLDTAAAVIARVYQLGIRPDWWELEADGGPESWQRYARVIAASDPYCRGILLRLHAPLAQPATLLAQAAREPLVRGFIGGDSIFAAAGEAWLAGRASAEATIAQVAEHLRSLRAAWLSARQQPRERAERSAD
jgi:5-dehydro-2-deoxygluconokinase